MKKFWSLTGKIHLVPEQLLEFLNENGFYNYRESYETTTKLIRKQKNVLNHVSIDEIKSFICEYVNTQEFEDPNEKRQVIELIFNLILTKQKLAVLKILDNLKFIEDTNEYAVVYFENGPFKINKDGIEIIWGEIPVYIWRSQIIDFHFNDIGIHRLSKWCFESFLKNISRDRITGELNEDNYNSLKSLIGYLLVTYKNKACNPAVIIRDIPRNDNPEGSTGKGILYEALSQIRKTIKEDGKTQNPDTRFVFSRVTSEVRILVFDDVKKNFPFENLFSAITEDLVVEKKNFDKYSIPFEKSPKILITSNYPIAGQGKSHDRRRFEFIISDYYNNVRRPISEFGKIFFSEWDYEEWLCFYYTMFDCISYYLANGLVPQKLTIADYNYITGSTKEFRIYAKSKLVIGEKYFTKDLHSEFMQLNPGHIQIEQNTFSRWIKLYALSSGYETVKDHSGNDSYFQFTKIE
jgi:hypothetical protein